MRHGSLFSGIGGFDLAAEWMGWENVFACEIDEWNQKLLKQNHPNTEIYGDIKQFDGTKYAGGIDVLSGGFPCQPFSVAGNRKGKDDERYLWPEMLRVIGEIKPTFIVGENVSGSWELVDEICSDLERQGFTPEPFGIEAASVGANHKRLRYWYCAYSNSLGLPRGTKPSQMERSEQQLSGLLPSSTWTKVSRPSINRVGHGIPNRIHRIKGLGNSVVPQVVFEIFKAIQSVHENTK